MWVQSYNSRKYEVIELCCRLVFGEKPDFIDGVSCKWFRRAVGSEVNLVDHGLWIAEGHDDVWLGVGGFGGGTGYEAVACGFCRFSERDQFPMVVEQRLTSFPVTECATTSEKPAQQDGGESELTESENHEQRDLDWKLDE